MYMYDLPQLWPIFATLPNKCKKKNASFFKQNAVSTKHSRHNSHIMIRKNIWGGKVLTRGTQGELFGKKSAFCDAFVTPWLWECFPGPAPRPWRPHLPKASRIPKDCRCWCGAHIGDVCWAWRERIPGEKHEKSNSSKSKQTDLDSAVYIHLLLYMILKIHHFAIIIFPHLRGVP